jgi:hypothetical protein
MRIRKKWPIAVLAAISVAVIGVTAGMAGSSALQQLQGDQAASPGATTVGGREISLVKVVREPAAQTTMSATFADLPGMSTTVRVPRGYRALILARFSAESYCSDSTDGFAGWCGVRIRIGSADGEPSDGSDPGTPFAFDSDSSGGDDYYEGNSMDRSRVLGPGLHTVKVQWAVTNPSILFWLDDASLTVERALRY